MTTQEREAIYEHCARLVGREVAAQLESGNAWVSVNVLLAVAAIIREHAADPVKYP